MQSTHYSFNQTIQIAHLHNDIKLCACPFSLSLSLLRFLSGWYLFLSSHFLLFWLCVHFIPLNAFIQNHGVALLTHRFVFENQWLKSIFFVMLWSVLDFSANNFYQKTHYRAISWNSFLDTFRQNPCSPLSMSITWAWMPSSCNKNSHQSLNKYKKYQSDWSKSRKESIRFFPQFCIYLTKNCNSCWITIIARRLTIYLIIQSYQLIWIFQTNLGFEVATVYSQRSQTIPMSKWSQ